MHQTKVDISQNIRKAVFDIAGATRRCREKLMRASEILMSLPLVLVSLASVHAQEVRTGAEAFGSWEEGTGYKVIRILVEDGEPTGVYEDFMTGFVLDDSLLVSDDANGTIFRVVYEGSR